MLSTATLLAALLGLSCSSASPLSARENWGKQDQSSGNDNSQSLSELAKQSNKYFGTAYQSFYLADPAFEPILNSQFDQYTPENEMKWEVIQAERGVFNWTGADLVSQFDGITRPFKADMSRSLIKQPRPARSSAATRSYGTRSSLNGCRTLQTKMICWM